MSSELAANDRQFAGEVEHIDGRARDLAQVVLAAANVRRFVIEPGTAADFDVAQARLGRAVGEALHCGIDIGALFKRKQE